MPVTPENIAMHPETLRPHLAGLEQLYGAMDQAYLERAGRYGFTCKGCKDSCCKTRFRHFTRIEYFYLKKGYERLNPALRRRLRERALDYCRHLEAADNRGNPLHKFCPLNGEGRCLLYPWRPMICRLHGLPHELHTPGRPPLFRPGCPEFSRQHGRHPYIPFDRTPFYQDLARLEQRFRKALGASGGIKMTVAEMLLHFESRFGAREHEKKAAPLRGAP